jgi:hypothetical protein
VLACAAGCNTMVYERGEHHGAIMVLRVVVDTSLMHPWALS